MTTEVVIMNNLAVAMAADSAVTSYTSQGPKIYNTANKIFSLSKFQPVGIMTYQSSDLLGIPWETIIKEYRDYLGSKKLDSIQKYGNHFTRFLSNHRGLFPASSQRQYVQVQSTLMFSGIYQRFEQVLETKLSEEGPISKRTVKIMLGDFVASFIDRVRENELADGFEKADINLFKRKYAREVKKARDIVFVEKRLTERIISLTSDMIAEAFCRDFPLPIYSGIVISGFGADEYCPCTYSTSIFGIVLDRIRRTKPNHSQVAPSDSRSMIIPYAQDDMIRSFMDGIDPRLSSHIKSAIKLLLDKYRTSVLDHIPEEFGKLISELSDNLLKTNKSLLAEFSDEISSYQDREHISPIMSVVSVLPKDEIAMMAETLVSLTSFKRRVSPGYESVGEPIDVAVITKGDGFVWIKRKHYFSIELNPDWIDRYLRE